MRHLKSYRKLGRESSHRRAMLRNMATSFLTHGKIHTTVPKAKELKPIVEKLITLGKRQELHSRRQLEAYLFGKEAAGRVCKVLAKRFETRPGGYTRIVKYGERFGDGADMCNLELVDFRDNEGKKEEKVEEAKAAE
ncbi:MAG: 50S ribosomal protein L17 [Oligoflexales bacterium]|nr:50S ribosomal protein L17 [Oligoflexales bacterium]